MRGELIGYFVFPKNLKISVSDYEKSHAPDPYVGVLNLSHFLYLRPDSIVKKDNELGQAENKDYGSCKLSECRKVIQFVNCAVRSKIMNNFTTHFQWETRQKKK